MNRQHAQNIYHANVNVNSMLENVIQIKSGITIYGDVSAKIGETTKRLYLES